MLILVIISISLHAQSSVSGEPDSSCSPQTWTYIGIGSVCAVTAILFHYDQKIYDELYRWKTKNNVVNNISPVITNIGDGAFSMGLFGGFAGYGLIFKNEKALLVGKIGIESFLFTGITVQLIKHLCSRERPSASTRHGGFWYGPFAYFDKSKSRGKGISSFDAFPSGHTSTAFAAATVLSDFYTESWVSYTCYSIATIVAVSRITERTHWASDCFVGAIIGYGGTKLIEKWNNDSIPITLLPTMDERNYGLSLTVRF